MRRHLKNKEIRHLIESIKERFGAELFSKKDKVEIIDDSIIYVNDEALMFFDEGEYVPTLKALIKDNFMKKVVVDMGAVKFVASGADVMRPGIVEIPDGIEEGDYVSVVDVNNKRPLAIGKAMFSSDDMRKKESGKVIKAVHHVGDELWGK